MATRLQVLAAVVLGLPCAVLAQPPDAPDEISNPQSAQYLPLLPIALDEWLAQNGGLTRLKLKMDGATADEIADEVRQQSGVEVEPYRDLRGDEDKVPRFSVEATGQPFWEAVLQWNRGTQALYMDSLANVRHDSTLTGWQLVTWNLIESGIQAQAGPCLLVASEISVNRWRQRKLIPAGQSTESGLLALSGSLLIDPRLRPLILGKALVVEGATDDQGRAIKAGHEFLYPWLEDSQELRFQLATPAHDATHLRSLKGLLRLAVVTKHQKWEIDLKAMPKAERKFKSAEAEVTLRFDGLVAQGNEAPGVPTEPHSWKALFYLKRTDIGPRRVFFSKGTDALFGARLGSHEDTTRAIRVLNAQGEVLPVKNFDSSGGGDEPTRLLDIKATIERGSQPDLQKATPAKIIIDLPLEWREVQIPFELKDLPLP